MANLERIELFLPTVEGHCHTVGYIPCDIKGTGKTANYTGEGDPSRYQAMGSSGVTIGTGVDLGQTDMATLQKIGVPHSIINPLIPYLGKKKDAALQVLHRLPLTVSPAVAATLDHCMHRHHLKLISARYDKDAGKGAFDSIPWQAQAVVYSLLYQHGTGGPRKFPITWAALVKQDWALAAAELCSDNWPRYHNRRHLEGMLLKGIC